MAESGLGALTVDAPVAAEPFEPQSALAALKLATEKLRASASAKADPWLSMSAGFGAPTKTGNFFESLGAANQGLAASLQRQRENELENAKLQASMVGMQADLPLKAMQQKMLNRQMEGMEMLGQSGPGDTAVPVAKGLSKAGAGIVAQGGASPMASGAAAAQEGEAAQALPKGVPSITEAYNMAKPPAPVAAATANFAKASGVQPIYDVGKLLQTGLYYQTIGAKYNLPQAGEIGRTLSNQATEFIKQGAMPVRMADGSTGMAPIPGYLQKVYGEHLAQNTAKWAGYGAAEKAAERANARDRITYEAQVTPMTGYDAAGNPIATTKLDLATGKASAVPPMAAGGSNGALGATGTTGQSSVGAPPMAPGASGAPSAKPLTLELNPQDKPTIEAEGKWLGELPTHMSMKQQELQSIEKMAAAYKLVESGKFAQHKAEISGVLKAAGIDPDKFNLTDRAQVQIALKEAMKNTLTSFKDIPAGSRFSQAEFMAMKNEGMANPDMEPAANLSILSGMHGVARNDLDFMNHVVRQKESNPGKRVSISSEMAKWYNDKPLKTYVEESTQKLGPFKGMKESLDPIAAEKARRAAARATAGE